MSIAADSKDSKPSPSGRGDSVWRLAAPIIISNLSVPLLGIVDTAVVGRLPGPEYLGAVAVGALVLSYIYWGFGFLRMSTTGLAAQALGGENWPEVKAVLYRAGAVAIGLSLIVLALHGPAIVLAFSIIDASAAVESLGADYIQFRIAGAPAALLSYVILGWFLGLQDSKTPLFLQLLTNGVNIVLNIWFVLGLDWGVPGVAAATAVAEWTGALVGIWLIRRRLAAMGGARTPRRAVVDLAAFKRFFAVNFDIFIRTLCLITAFAYFTAKGAAFGDVILAANAVLNNFIMLAAHGLDGFAHAAEALVGKQIGRRNRAAVSRAVREAFLWAGATAALATGVFLLAGPAIIDGLTTVADVREAARDYLLWAAIMPVVGAWCYIFDGVFLGATRTAAIRNAMLVSTGLYLGAAWALAEGFGNHGLWAALMLFMAMRGVTLWVGYPGLLRSAQPKAQTAKAPAA